MKGKKEFSKKFAREFFVTYRRSFHTRLSSVRRVTPAELRSGDQSRVTTRKEVKVWLGI